LGPKLTKKGWGSNFSVNPKEELY